MNSGELVILTLRSENSTALSIGFRSCVYLKAFHNSTALRIGFRSFVFEDTFHSEHFTPQNCQPTFSSVHKPLSSDRCRQPRHEHAWIEV